MKQTLFILVFILTFVFRASAQITEGTCGKLIIDAPLNVSPGETFTVSAKYEKNKNSDKSKFNWIIINQNKLTEKDNSETVEITSKGIDSKLKETPTIIIIVKSANKNCQDSKVIARVYVVDACILPFTIDEYSNIKWNDERARLDNVILHMQNFEDLNLFIFLDFDKKIPPIRKRNRLKKILNYLSVTRNFKKDRIVFLISDSESESARFQPLPKDLLNTFFSDYFSIKGEDFDKLEKLFQTNTKINNKK